MIVNGVIWIVVKVGEVVKFRVYVVFVFGEGEIVVLEWDWEGIGDFVLYKLGILCYVIDVKV